MYKVELSSTGDLLLKPENGSPSAERLATDITVAINAKIGVQVSISYGFLTALVAAIRSGPIDLPEDYGDWVKCCSVLCLGFLDRGALDVEKHLRDYTMDKARNLDVETPLESDDIAEFSLFATGLMSVFVNAKGGTLTGYNQTHAILSCSRQVMEVICPLAGKYTCDSPTVYGLPHRDDRVLSIIPVGFIKDLGNEADIDRMIEEVKKNDNAMMLCDLAFIGMEGDRHQFHFVGSVFDTGSIS